MVRAPQPEAPARLIDPKRQAGMSLWLKVPNVLLDFIAKMIEANYRTEEL
jgi:hypothetical protein